MPRSGGIYTLPAGNPVVTLTTISSTWANTTLSDIATALTGSLPVDGSAAMTGDLRLADGLIGSPGLTWATETTSGWYRIGTGNFGFSIGSAQILGLGNTTLSAAVIDAQTTNTYVLQLVGPSNGACYLSLKNTQAAYEWFICTGRIVASYFEIYDNTRGASVFNISTVGASSFTGGTTTGYTVTINNATGSSGPCLSLNAGQASDNIYLGIARNGSANGFIGGSGATNGLVTTSVAGDIMLIGQGAGVGLSSTQNNYCLYINSSGIIQASNGTSALVGAVFAGVPVELVSGATYSLVLADFSKNKFFNRTGSCAITIPANTSVAFPVGTIISGSYFCTVAGSLAITTDNLYWVDGTGTTKTGTRTLAITSSFTLIKIQSTAWQLTGVGIS